MTDCEKINELMMDYVYQELDANSTTAFRSHVDGCARCGAELAGLERTRQALRALPDSDPPAAVTALLLHEAAKRAPSKSAKDEKESKGFLAWLAGLFAPIMAHPAWAAAASLILVAGVAGYLSVKGMVNEHGPTQAAYDDADNKDLKLAETKPQGTLEFTTEKPPAAAVPEAPSADDFQGNLRTADPTMGAHGGKAGDKLDEGVGGADTDGRWGKNLDEETQRQLENNKRGVTDDSGSMVVNDGVARGSVNAVTGVGGGGQVVSKGNSAEPAHHSSSNGPATVTLQSSPSGGEVLHDDRAQTQDKTKKPADYESSVAKDVPPADNRGPVSNPEPAKPTKAPEPKPVVVATPAPPPPAESPRDESTALGSAGPAPSTAQAPQGYKPSYSPPPKAAPRQDLKQSVQNDAWEDGDAVTSEKESAGRKNETAKKAKKPEPTAQQKEFDMLYGQARAKANNGDCGGANAIKQKLYKTYPQNRSRLANDVALSKCDTSSREKYRKSAPANDYESPYAPSQAQPAPPAPDKTESK